MATTTDKASCAEFFHVWAQQRGWKAPAFHYRVCDWLEHRGETAVLMMARGFGKSTLLAIHNAWRYYCDPTHRILHQGPDDPTAYKTARDTKAVLMRHPLTRHLRSIRGEVSFWWVPGANDERNPSMQAAGVLSNITSSRADEVQNDDVEVPRNITTPEAREKLRYRLGEQTHIAVPGARTLYVGTPHTHDSLYQEQIDAGADALIIRLFEFEHRVEDCAEKRVRLPFRPDVVFAGVGKQARLLVEGTDYQLRPDGVEFRADPPGGLVDFYAGCAWPERFGRGELIKRRRKCRTINEWDSQYQLHAKPVNEIRLNPDNLRAYAVEPNLVMGYGRVEFWLGKALMVGACAYWDPALGKVDTCDSVLSIVFTDQRGHYYWHRAAELTGDIDSQCLQVLALVKTYQLTGVTVETNGLGAFVPDILRKHLRTTGCAVTEVTRTGNKHAYILDAIETPLSGRFLWAHVSLWEGKMPDQMRDYVPGASGQRVDYLDSLAGAIMQTPARIGHVVGTMPATERVQVWSPGAGQHEVDVDFG